MELHVAAQPSAAVSDSAGCSLQQQMENSETERDIYDELLTQAEIQGNINSVNSESDASASTRFHGAPQTCRPFLHSERCPECR